MGRMGVGDVQVGPLQGGDRTSRQSLEKVLAEHPARAGDQIPRHRAARVLRGSHQERFSLYQATVAAMPASNVTAGA
ncbi:hypothetical protein GCM10027610_079370 [Dactylosporangium cerinum]